MQGFLLVPTLLGFLQKNAFCLEWKAAQLGLLRVCVTSSTYYCVAPRGMREGRLVFVFVSL